MVKSGLSLKIKSFLAKYDIHEISRLMPKYIQLIAFYFSTYSVHLLHGSKPTRGMALLAVLYIRLTGLCAFAP
jgi:hypothetical protein